MRAISLHIESPSYFQGLFQFKAKIPHPMKSKVRKYNILRNQHKKFAKNKKLSEIQCICLCFSQIRARANYNRFLQVRSRKKPNGP